MGSKFPMLRQRYVTPLTPTALTGHKAMVNFYLLLVKGFIALSVVEYDRKLFRIAFLIVVSANWLHGGILGKEYC